MNHIINVPCVIQMKLKALNTSFYAHALDANTKKVEFYAVYPFLRNVMEKTTQSTAFFTLDTCGSREYYFIFTDI